MQATAPAAVDNPYSRVTCLEGSLTAKVSILVLHSRSRWLASLPERMCVHTGDGQTYLARVDIRL